MVGVLYLAQYVIFYKSTFFEFCWKLWAMSVLVGGGAMFTCGELVCDCVVFDVISMSVW